MDPVALSEHVASEGDSLIETAGAAIDVWGRPASAALPPMHGSVVPVDSRVGMEP